MRMLGSKLPEHEVEYAVEDALVDAGYAGSLRAASTLLHSNWISTLRGCLVGKIAGRLHTGSPRVGC